MTVLTEGTYSPLLRDAAIATCRGAAPTKWLSTWVDLPCGLTNDELLRLISSGVRPQELKVVLYLVAITRGAGIDAVHLFLDEIAVALDAHPVAVGRSLRRLRSAGIVTQVMKGTCNHRGVFRITLPGASS